MVMSAIGTKRTCLAVHRTCPLSGVKRTCLLAGCKCPLMTQSGRPSFQRDVGVVTVRL